MALTISNPQEEERKRRMAFGKAQGLDDATIAKYELIAQIKEKQAQQAAQQQQPQQAQEQKKGPSGLKRFLVNTGAIAGSVATGIGAAAAVPFTGGASLAGGFAAGAGIEALRRKLLGEKQNVGASALEGGLTILPGVGKAIKTLKNAGKVAKTLDVAADASKVSKATNVARTVVPAEKAELQRLLKAGLITPKDAEYATKNISAISGQVTKPTTQAAAKVSEKESLKQALLDSFKSKPTGVISGKIDKAAEAAKAEARGVKTGLKPQGAAEKLLPSQAEEINKTLSSVPRKGAFGRQTKGTVGGVPRQLRDVETAQQSALKNMDDILTKNNKAIDPKDRAEILQGLRDDRKQILGLKKTHIDEAADLEKRVAGAKDYKELEALRRKSDARINFARNPNSPDQSLEEVYMSLRRNIDKKISSLVPDLKVAKTTYGKLESAKDALVMNAPGTLKSGGSVVGKVAGSGLGQKGFDVAGNALKRTAKVVSSPVLKTGFQQGVARSLTKPYIDPAQPGQQQAGQLPQDPSLLFAEPSNPDEAVANQIAEAGITDPNEMFAVLSGQSQGGEVAGANTGAAPGRAAQYADMADQLFNAGDIKNAKSALEFAKVYADFEKNAEVGKGGKLNSEQQKSLNKIGSAENIVGQMEGLLSEIGLSESGIGAKQRGISTKVGAFFGDPGARTYYDSVGALSTKLSRALGEVGTMTDKDREVAIKLVPGPGDTKASAARKLKLLYTFFQDEKDKIGGLPGSSESGSSLDDFSDDELVQQLTEQRGY